MKCGNKICYCTGDCRRGDSSTGPTWYPNYTPRKIKSVEYHPDGTIKKVEYFD